MAVVITMEVVGFYVSPQTYNRCSSESGPVFLGAAAREFGGTPGAHAH